MCQGVLPHKEITGHLSSAIVVSRGGMNFLYQLTGLQRPMCLRPQNCKRLQDAADARRRARRRTFVLQVSDNKADAVPCECLRTF